MASLGDEPLDRVHVVPRKDSERLADDLWDARTTWHGVRAVPRAG